MSKFEIAVRLYKSYLITEALQRANGNQCEAARSLGLHRNSLRHNMRRLGITLDVPGRQRMCKPTPVAAAAIANQRRA